MSIRFGTKSTKRSKDIQLALGEIGPAAADCAHDILYIQAEKGYGFEDEVPNVLAKTGGGGIPLFIDALKNPDFDIRFRAITSLGKLGGEAATAVPQLLERFRTGDDDEKWFVALNLLNIDPTQKEVVPYLIGVMQRHEKRDRDWQAAQILGKTRGSDEAIAALTKQLHKGSNDVRRQAAMALEGMPSQKGAQSAVQYYHWNRIGQFTAVTLWGIGILFGFFYGTRIFIRSGINTRIAIWPAFTIGAFLFCMVLLTGFGPGLGMSRDVSFFQMLFSFPIYSVFPFLIGLPIILIFLFAGWSIATLIPMFSEACKKMQPWHLIFAAVSCGLLIMTVIFAAYSGPFLKFHM